MTVAIIMRTPEGIILGSDSATTVSFMSPKGAQIGQLFNSAQKLFEIGPASDGFTAGCDFSAGMVIWGDASFGPISWRSFASEFYCRTVSSATDLSNVPKLILEFAQKKWTELQEMAMVPATQSIPDTGIGVAAIHKGEHEVHGGIVSTRNATAAPIQIGEIRVGGDPSAFQRVVFGYDDKLRQGLINAGVDQNLFQACAKQFDLSQFLVHIPLRDAIDFVHFLIYSAIKLHRYKGGPAVVGGPIEIASITPDRGFRWTLHKPLNESIGIPRGEGIS